MPILGKTSALNERRILRVENFYTQPPVGADQVSIILIPMRNFFQARLMLVRNTSEMKLSLKIFAVSVSNFEIKLHKGTTMINFIHRVGSAIAIVASVLCVAAPAHATLLDGKTVRLEHDFSAPGSNIASVDVVVGPGVEWAAGLAGIYRVDVSDTSLNITFNNAGGTWNTCCSFNGLHLIDIGNSIAAFTSVSLSSTNFGFPPSAVTFDADNIYVNFGAYGTTPSGGTINISINGSEVPEPASIALIGLGLMGLALGRRKQV